MKISERVRSRWLIPGLIMLGLLGWSETRMSRGQGLPGQIPGAAQGSDPLHQRNRDDPSLPNDIQAKQGRARNDERQRKLVADTDKLLALATSLHDDVAKTNKDVMSLDVIRRADEIEKLAHAVKERMKG